MFFYMILIFDAISLLFKLPFKIYLGPFVMSIRSPISTPYPPPKSIHVSTTILSETAKFNSDILRDLMRPDWSFVLLARTTTEALVKYTRKRYGKTVHEAAAQHQFCLAVRPYLVTNGWSCIVLLLCLECMLLNTQNLNNFIKTALSLYIKISSYS